MKKWQSRLLLLATTISLASIVAVTLFNFIKKQGNKTNENIADKQQVLGESQIDEIGAKVPQVLQNTFNNTKDLINQKVVEIEKSILTTISKEVQNLSNSQIQSLKVQICTDLGVITPKPTSN